MPFDFFPESLKIKVSDQAIKAGTKVAKAAKMPKFFTDQLENLLSDAEFLQDFNLAIKASLENIKINDHNKLPIIKEVLVKSGFFEKKVVLNLIKKILIEELASDIDTGKRLLYETIITTEPSIADDGGVIVSVFFERFFKGLESRSAAIPELVDYIKNNETRRDSASSKALELYNSHLNEIIIDSMVEKLSPYQKQICSDLFIANGLHNVIKIDGTNSKKLPPPNSNIPAQDTFTRNIEEVLTISLFNTSLRSILLKKYDDNILEEIDDNNLAQYVVTKAKEDSKNDSVEMLVVAFETCSKVMNSPCKVDNEDQLKKFFYSIWVASLKKNTKITLKPAEGEAIELPVIKPTSVEILMAKLHAIDPKFIQKEQGLVGEHSIQIANKTQSSQEDKSASQAISTEQKPDWEAAREGGWEIDSQVAEIGKIVYKKITKTSIHEMGEYEWEELNSSIEVETGKKLHRLEASISEKDTNPICNKAVVSKLKNENRLSHLMIVHYGIKDGRDPREARINGIVGSFHRSLIEYKQKKETTNV